tara:strand:- start:729 stop:1949 length:1221 start_codon:yes stop_codon:yes gene_type:complete
MSETQEEITTGKDGVLEQGEFKVKKKPKNLGNNKKDTPKMVIKKDADKPDVAKLEIKKEEDAVSESKPVHVDEDKQTGDVQKVESGTSESGLQEITKEEKQEESGSPIQEITGEEEKEITPPIKDTVESSPEVKLPEGVEKLVSFMEQTGGDIEDYIRLNADYSNVDDDTLLREFYTQTKSHLEGDDVNFLMEENFGYDADYDEEKVIRRKKLAKKEEVQKAKKFLNKLKDDYYTEIKLRPGVTQEQQKATEFFNRYNKEQETAKQKHEVFKQTTNNFFGEGFKGFEFNLADKKFRYGVNNPQKIAEKQADISNVIKTFLNDKGEITDYAGYHKAMYAAGNADKIAKHFYDQGIADGTRSMISNSKNISNNARATQTPDDGIYLNGMKLKAVSGVDSSKLKIKKRK